MSTIEVGAFKHGLHLLNWEATFRPGRPLVVVFSGVDTVPTRCKTSYYGLHAHLDASVAHIHDNFGAHGNYLLCRGGDDRIQEAVLALLRMLISRAGVTPRETHLVGTSKGATTALCYALLLGDNCRCIAGEPQIRLGDFLLPQHRQGPEDLRSIAYAMTGRVDPAAHEELNALLPQILTPRIAPFGGQIELFYGDRTGYWPWHISHFDALISSVEARRPDRPIRRRIQIVKERYQRHNDTIPLFKARIEARFGTLG